MSKQHNRADLAEKQAADIVVAVKSMLQETLQYWGSINDPDPWKDYPQRAACQDILNAARAYFLIHSFDLVRNEIRFRDDARVCSNAPRLVAGLQYLRDHPGRSDPAIFERAFARINDTVRAAEAFYYPTRKRKTSDGSVDASTPSSATPSAIPRP